MTFFELYKKLDVLFPKELSCEWDNDGIMCADNLNRTVKKVLISLDVTDETVKFAFENGFDTIISHHPLVFKPQRSISPLNYTQKKLIELIRKGIGVMSFHTRLDAADGGVNDMLAAELGFFETEKDKENPIGRIVTLEHDSSISTFVKGVKTKLGAPIVSYSGGDFVKRIYIVGGDGKDCIADAIRCGADTLLTGSASYNSAIDAIEMGLNIIEAGHFYTENPVCKALKETIEGIDSQIEVQLFNSNKIKFI